MTFDFSQAPVKNRAFSEKAMTFIDQEPKNFLAAIIDLIAIETGNRTAREYWQKKQLQNLLQHAAQRSEFWRRRIGARKIAGIHLSDLPMLTRSELAKQVETEGSLLPPGGNIPSKKHATSGSSGTPVQFFVSDMNGQYNNVRTMAQYFMEGRDLTLNRTRFKASRIRPEGGFSVERTGGWLGPLSAVFNGGTGKEIAHLNADRDLLMKELTKDPIGYLVMQPRHVDVLFPDGDVSFLSENGAKMFIPMSEEADNALRERFATARIPVRATYSTEEVGFVAAECPSSPGTYHVAESNVIVEVDNREGAIVNGNRLGRVLITHLHSYATPFVRYDIGDFASLSERCMCGHDGPTLTNIYGRSKRLLKRADGGVAPFSVSAGTVLKVVKCDEYRIRQISVDTIDVEIGGIDQLTADQMSSLQKLFKDRAGDEFTIRISTVQKIDWGNDTKRLGFRSELF
jgi:phenylacetate-CoA ligase